MNAAEGQVLHFRSQVSVKHSMFWTEGTVELLLHSFRVLGSILDTVFPCVCVGLTIKHDHPIKICELISYV